MTSASPASFTVRIQRVRKRGVFGITASALRLDEHGQAVPNAPRYAVSISDRVAAVPVEQGQWWRVAGHAKAVDYEVDGWRVVEQHLVAERAQLLRPSGEHVVQLLSTSPAFPGIGEVKARRLWEALGSRLYEALDSEDAATLETVVGAELAAVLIAGWATFESSDAVQEFQRIGLDLRLSRKLLAVYGKDALASVQADPYRVIAFGMTWRAADALARRHFSVADDDDRRLSAAVESVLYATLDEGHTFVERAELSTRVQRLVGVRHVEAAMDHAVAAHHVMQLGSRLHALGPWLIEDTIATALRRLAGSVSAVMEPSQVEELTNRFEREEAALIGDASFALNEAQRRAVEAAAAQSLLLITGGAGVGKTTVLKCIRTLFDEAGLQTYQMALSGRAAKRMSEATGKPSMTIAGFLKNVACDGLPDQSAVVVDEASMLDILLAYRLIGVLPPTCRLLLIGDPAQLPPVGPGLTLHALVDVPEIPKVELTVVRRFGGAIASVAHAVRQGELPELTEDTSTPISFVPCTSSDLERQVLSLFLQAPADTQILTFTRERGASSSRSLNRACQLVAADSARRLLVHSAERGRLEDTGLRLGEPVLCTKNLWDVGVQNGSLGRLHAIEDVPVADLDGTLTYGWVRWDDGELRPLTLEVLDALELGYAITVHKAQGSQFRRIIVPVQAARNLDRTMLYTAITRATEQVILVGDVDVARRVIAAMPHAARRRVALAAMLTRLEEA